VITTVAEVRSQIADSRSIRTTALAQRVPYYTTMAGGRAAIEGMKYLDTIEVYDLQSLHRRLRQA
jgi:carbamoyl-phosphate synthase large subunit